MVFCFILPMAGKVQTENTPFNDIPNLQEAKTTSDSIRILLDVYSFGNKVNRDKVRGQIITLVQNSNSKEFIDEVLTELSTTTDDAKDLARLIQLSENLPKDSARDNLQTVMIMEKAQADAQGVGDSSVEQQVMDFMRQGMGLANDPYKEIQNIYRTMMYLGSSSQGPLYFEYIKRLETLVDALPKEDRAIRNLFYTTAALFYTRKRDYQKAIDYDQKLIKLLDEIEAQYDNQDKARQDLDYFYYVSYRRMLRNFKGLTPEQIEDTYRKCVEIAAENAQAAEEFGNGGLTNSYYYMATKQYAKAVPELKKALSVENISNFRRQELLGHLAYALRNTGDKNGELETLREYAQMLLKDRAERRNDMYREIELRNSVSQLMADEYRQQEKQRQENRVMRKTSITLVYVLAILLIFIGMSYIKLRHKVKDLEKRNKKLHRNIEDIFDDGTPKGTSDLYRQHHRLKG